MHFKLSDWIGLITGLPLGGRTAYITSKIRLRTLKLHIKDVPRTSENFPVRPKLDIETSSLQKKTAHNYQIMSRLRIGNSFILFIDHARTSHLTNFESLIDSQCHVYASVGSVIIKACHPTGVKTSTHLDNGLRNHSREIDIQSLGNQVKRPICVRFDWQLRNLWNTESADVTLCTLVK